MKTEVSVKFRGISFFKAAAFSIVLAAEFFLVESYEHNPLEDVRTTAMFFNILILVLIGWILFLLTGKAKIAIWVETFMVMVFGLTNHYVMEFRSTPFVPWDLLSIKTAKSVANQYQFTFPARVIIVTMLFLIIMVGAFFFQYEMKRQYLLRGVTAVILIAFFIVFGKNLQDEDFQTKYYLYPFLFTPAYMTKVNGMLVTFAMNLSYIVIDKPAGYSAEKAEAMLNQYHVEETVDIEELPNIIVVMNEAFSDLSVLNDFHTNEDYMPFVHRLNEGNENTVTGKLHVSVCGGNTANTEFEFLTGNTMQFLPSGSIPYQQYIKGERESMASYLKDLGYETYAFHPYNSTGWNRNEVYPWIGFDHVYFRKDMRKLELVRDYVSDASDYDFVVDLYEKRDKNKPFFLFNVTMQNHGSYSDAYDNFVPNIDVENTNSYALEQYLSLIQLSDAELQQLIAYFEQQKEKTVIVFFGDHQPNDYVANQMLMSVGRQVDEFEDEDLSLRYQVPYVIWANYDIEEGKNRDISANYLGAEVLAVAGVKTSDYMNYLLDLRENYPIISAVSTRNAAGEEVSKQEKKELLDYQRLQYYFLFD